MPGLRYNLETRCPFLDHKMVEFAASLPINLKIINGNHKNNKYLCKNILLNIWMKKYLYR